MGHNIVLEMSSEEYEVRNIYGFVNKASGRRLGPLFFVVKSPLLFTWLM